MEKLQEFVDILSARRQDVSTILHFLQEHYAQVAYKQAFKPKPEFHKLCVVENLKSRDLLMKFGKSMGVPADVVEEKVKIILNEIGFNMNLGVIRFLGIILTKICLQVCSAIYVHHSSIMQVKGSMGSTPVVLVPSHRSYADFILMSYVMYNYNITIPVTAAGMDFHGMKGMGKILRDTGAFFMRRTYNDDDLYWLVFRTYIHQLVTKHDAPIQFFLEGTRSRSGKSLVPKYGLLSMVVKTYVTSEVPDVLFVPVSINYDRILEEKLFAFELLGVPKPKESTSALIKSLNLVYERYGNIYFNFGEPCSLKAYVDDKLNRASYNLRPVNAQVDDSVKQILPEFAFDIIGKQQALNVTTVFNLIAVSLSASFADRRELSIDELCDEVSWCTTLLGSYEARIARIDACDVKRDVMKALKIHSNLLRVEEGGDKIKMVFNEVKLDSVCVSQLKAHVLHEKTMTYCVPFVMLQLYVNPVLCVLIDSILITCVLNGFSNGCEKDDLFDRYVFCKNLFCFDFVICKTSTRQLFDSTVALLMKLNAVSATQTTVFPGSNQKLICVFSNLFAPFLMSYRMVISVLMESGSNKLQECQILKTAQSELENQINNSEDFVHPYVLSLDTLKNCLCSLVAQGAINKEQINGNIYFSIQFEVLSIIDSQLGSVGQNNNSPSVKIIKNKL